MWDFMNGYHYQAFAVKILAFYVSTKCNSTSLSLRKIILLPAIFTAQRGTKETKEALEYIYFFLLPLVIPHSMLRLNELFILVP